MPSLRDHLLRTPEVRPRNLGLWMAPALAGWGTPTSPRLVEEAALTVLAHVVQESGPTREQLVRERVRFERLENIVLRLPERGGGG
jgi:hypothetical protein